MKVKDLINSICSICTMGLKSNDKLTIGFYDNDHKWHEAKDVIIHRIENQSKIQDIVVLKQREIKMELIVPLDDKIQAIKNDIQNVLERY